MDYSRLSESQKKRVNDHFKEVIYPVLTPLASNPAIRSRTYPTSSLNLAIVIKMKRKISIRTRESA